MKILMFALLAMLSGCQVVPVTITLGAPVADSARPVAPGTKAPVLRSPAWTAATGGPTPVSAASPPNLAQAFLGQAFWQDDPVNQGHFVEEKYGLGLGIGQTFRLKQSGRVRAVRVWLGGEIDPAGVMFTFHAYKNSQAVGPVLGRGTITEIAGPGVVQDARECRVTFVPSPAVAAGTRYAFIADPIRKDVVLKAFSTTGYPADKDETELFYWGGWQGRDEQDLKYTLEIDAEASATAR